MTIHIWKSQQRMPGMRRMVVVATMLAVAFPLIGCSPPSYSTLSGAALGCETSWKNYPC